MRVVYLPVVSARNQQAAPSYNWFMALREHWLKKDPNVVFYVIVPRVTDENRWHEGADWSGPRTHVVPIDMAEMQFDELALVTRDWFERFNERVGDLYFDLILTERPMTVPIIRKLVQHPIVSKSRRPLIVTRDQIVMTTKWFKCDPIEEVLQGAGYAAAPTIFQSPHQAKIAMKTTAKHLSAAHVNRMGDMLKVFPLGIDCDDIDEINGAEREQKHDQITVNYSHKLFVEQKFLESLKIMDSTFAGGRDIRLQVVTGSQAGKFDLMPRAKPFKYMEIHGSQNRHQFLRQAAKAHVFISNSYYEDFSATVAEQIYTGLIPVLKREDWSEYLCGEEYPFLFDSMTEGQTMLRYVIDNYETVRDQYVPALQAKMRNEFDLKRILPEMIDWIAGLREEWLEGQKAGNLPEIVEEAYETLPDEFGAEDVYAALKKVATMLDVTADHLESRQTSKWLVLDVMLRAHPDLVDLGTEQIRWRKPA